MFDPLSLLQSTPVVPNFFCIPPFAHFGTFHSSLMELSFLPCSGLYVSIKYNWNNGLLEQSQKQGLKYSRMLQTTMVSYPD